MNTKNDKGESYTIIHSGQKDTHHRGVALIMNRESANTLMEWEPINNNNNNNNCLKSNIQCIEIRVQWTVHLGSSLQLKVLQTYYHAMLCTNK